MGQGGRAGGGALRRRYVFGNLGRSSLGHSGVDQLERPGDAGQEIIEVVRQSACKLADSLHLLTLPEKLVPPEILGDVAANCVKSSEA